MNWFARIFGRPSAAQAPARPLAAPLALTTSLPEVVPTAALLEQLGWKKPAMWASVLTPACLKHEVVTRLRLAAFLANTGHETNGGSALVESLNYSAEALVSKFGRHRITVEQASKPARTSTTVLTMTVAPAAATACAIPSPASLMASKKRSVSPSSALAL